ncbi:MAG: outer membrane protein assembly factor BamD [candidate division WOR-3 bacterium]
MSGYFLSEESLTPLRNPVLRFVLFLIVLLGFGGCAYFNTFYNAQKYYNEGLQLKNQNQLGQARAKFDKAIEKSALVLVRWPRSRWADDALYLIGMSYFHESQYQKALYHLDQFVLAFPESKLIPEAELHRGLALQAQREYGQAWVVLDNIRRRHARLADAAAYYLTQPALEREEFEVAVESLAAFVERYPRSRFRRQALRQLADACFRLGRPAEAEKWYRRYERLETNSRERLWVKLQIALCRFEMADYDAVVAGVRDLLGRNAETDEEAKLLLGRALERLGRHHEAAAVWSEVRGPNARGAEAAFRLGRYHEEVGDFARARAYYDTARSRRADSDYGGMAVRRLSLLNALARRDSIGSDSAHIEFLLAEIYSLNLGDYERAEQQYQHVYERFPESELAPKALLARAWIKRSVRRDTAAAEPILRRLIAAYPETEYADEARRWLGLPVPRRRVTAVPTTRGDTLAMSQAGQPADTSPAQPTERMPEPSIEPEPPEMMSGPVPEQSRGQPVPEPSLPMPKSQGMTVDSLTGQARISTVRAESAARAAVRPDSGQRPSAGAGGFEPVHFETDSWRILPQDTARLRTLAEQLRETSGMVVIEGHCDPRGSEQYNEALGMRRAESVRDWLVSNGVPAERLRVVSRGESTLLSRSPSEYWKDRRVEFRLE